jgi:D-sedoheptulose 7-phosphate isomerase
VVKENVQTAFEMLKACFEKGNRLYLCGSGGSSSDCEHMAGERLKSFKKTRPLPIELENKLKEYGTEGEKLTQGLEGGLPIISLCGHTAFSTAYQNDKDPMFTFA